MKKVLNPLTAFSLVNEAWCDEQILLSNLVQSIADDVVQQGSFTNAIERVARMPGFSRFFEYDPADPAASFRPHQHLLFPPDKPIDMLLISPDVSRADAYAEQRCLLLTTSEMVRQAADTLAWIAGDQQTAVPLPPLLDSLDALGCLTDAELPPFPSRFARNGIHRLQHASLLYVYNGASVLIDPVLHSIGFGRAATDPALLEISRSCSAILISHSHGDHFEPASLALFSRQKPIIVPKISRTNILTSSIVAPLHAMGFENIIEVEWWQQAIKVGDITVTALPFYGEQPRSQAPLRHTELRNIGNTYLIETPCDRSWLIVDTGDEFDQKMSSVALTLKEKYGSVDHVASNLGKFRIRIPTYVSGSGSYWVCLKNEDMASFAQLKSECLTLGPQGVAELIAACNCRSFIPYADWWGEMGQPSTNQADLTDELKVELKRVGSACSVENINIGDSLLF